MPYIGTSPSNGVRRKHTYTATASQTSFSGAGAEGATLSYNDSNFVDVYQNGVKLSEADYTSTSGTAIVLATGATVSDMIEIIVYDVFSVADTVSKADGGTFDGNVTMGGTLGVTGVPTFTGRSVHSGGITVANDGQIGSVGDADAMAISSSGVVTFSQTPVGAGGMVKLLDATISSAVSEYDISSTYINSTYDEYIISFSFLPSSDNNDLFMRVFVGGSVQTGSKYAYEAQADLHGSNQSNGQTYFRLNVGGIGNAAGEGIFGRIHLHNINTTTHPFNYTGMVNGASTSGSHFALDVGGMLLPADRGDVINGIRFYQSANNIASGKVRVYGLA